VCPAFRAAAANPTASWIAAPPGSLLKYTYTSALFELAPFELALFELALFELALVELALVELAPLGQPSASRLTQARSPAGR
jgi:hypothetical protein